MAKGLRACPVCPQCNSKKFKVIENRNSITIVQCLQCAKRISI